MTRSCLIHALGWLLGALFIFSGATKSIDPVGTSIFVEKYLVTYGLEPLMPAALALGVAVAVVEVAVGVMLIGGVMRRMVALLSFVMMALFTVVTLLSATVLPIGDCGCFGEVVSLTPWGTFLKNLVILPITFFVWRCAERRAFSRRDAVITAVAILLPLGVNLYALRHQPFVDLMPYKVGTDLREAVAREREAEDVRSVLRFRNIVTGAVEEFAAEDAECWLREDLEYVDVRTERVVKEDDNYADFVLYNAYGEDVTDDVLARSGRVAWLTIYDSSAITSEHREAIGRLYAAYPTSAVVVLTADKEMEIPEVEGSEVYGVDAMTLRSINRANVGVVVLRDGVVEFKADIRDI